MATAGRVRNWAPFGHGAMSELSPLSGVKLKSDSGPSDPERKSRSYSITSVARIPMYCPAFLGSFGWGLQQLFSQFVVAGVALCHIF